MNNYTPWVDETEQPDSTYRKLWLSVLHLAAEDAEGHNGSAGSVEVVRTFLGKQIVEKRILGKLQRNAIAWLTDGNIDFSLVCTLAGVDPEWSLKHFRERFAGGEEAGRVRKVAKRSRFITGESKGSGRKKAT